MRTAAPDSLSNETKDADTPTSSTPPHQFPPSRSPSPKVVLTPSCRRKTRKKRDRQVSLCAPHTVVSQHMSTLPHTSGTHILLLSRRSGQASFVRDVILHSIATSDSWSQRHAKPRAHCTPAPSLRFRCRRIERYVLWSSRFPNANITHMECGVHVHDQTGDSCLISTAALHEVHRLAHHSIYVGDGRNGWMWAGAQRSTLVLGPPRSGKTSSLVIPNILLSDGPVVSTSTKPDVMLSTATSRCRDGWTFLYDPSGEIDCPPHVERVGWSPLTTAASWDAAVVTADAMVGASRLSGARTGEHHWTERAGALLSTLLHAAAIEDLSMPEVLRWIDRHTAAPALEILTARAGDDVPATDLLSGIVATDSREQSGIWSTASGVLAAYRTAGALASTTAPPLDLDSFCRGANTLYICSTGRRQRQFAPLVVSVIGDVRDAAYTRARDLWSRWAANAARARRGGQHRTDPGPPLYGQRGGRSGVVGAGLPAGPLPGSGSLGRCS